MDDVSMSSYSMCPTTTENDISNASQFTPFMKTSCTRVPEGCVVLQFTDYIPWDNKYDPVSRKAELLFEFIVNGALLPVMFLFGTVTNVLNMAVFFRQGIKERVHFCLFFLALIDFLFILQAFCRYADRQYLQAINAPRYGMMAAIFHGNKLIGLFGFAWASAFTTTIIACERCFCVVSPLRSQTILKTKTMVFIILASSLIMLGGFFVVGARWENMCIYNPVSNSTTLTAYSSKFFLENPVLLTALDSVVYGVLIPGFCVIVVTVTTVISVVKVRQMSSWREKSTSAVTLSSRDIILTRMIIGTSILFISCLSPLLLRITFLFIPDLSLSGRYYNSFNVFMFICTLGGYINSSFDFFIYYRYGSKFRVTFWEIFTCIKTNKKNMKLRHIMDTTSEIIKNNDIDT